MCERANKILLDYVRPHLDSINGFPYCEELGRHNIGHVATNPKTNISNILLVSIIVDRTV